jgi:aromatic ring-opening dioxygenase catalytic subunit (LigB family)
MTLINPSANVPVVQVSVMTSDSPAQHYAMGKALASLRNSNVAIVGSGMPTFHNLRLLFSGAVNDPRVKARNAEWSEQLTNTIQIEDGSERGKKLEGWRDFVGAKEAHPQGSVEHFLPLIVCAGAGGEGKAEAFEDNMAGTKQFSYYWK